MRKTSQDGGDTTSITSGTENELKKVSVTKTKRNSIKKKVQNFSNESDDGVIEPLLQKDKDKIETINPSAKYLPSKFKTDSEKPIEKNLKAVDTKVLKTQSPVGVKETTNLKSPTSNIAPIHNHMNTNVFVNQDNFKAIVSSQSQILVEIDGKKPVSYTPSPLIFTTAKIHTDGKTKQVEPVQVTPVPILSTLEGSGLKSGVMTSVDKSNTLPTTVSGLSEVKTFEKLHKNGNPISIANIKTEKVGNNIISNSQTVLNNKFTSAVVAQNQPLTQEVKIIKPLNSETIQKSVEKESTLVCSTIKTTSGVITKPLQSDLSYSSSSTEPSKSKLSTLNSKQQCNQTDNTPKNLSTSKADEKSINKEISKVQENQISSNKHEKNNSSVDTYKTIKQISLDNTNLPSKVRESIDNTDKEKLNKLTSNRQLHRQKKSAIDDSDFKPLPTTKDVSNLNNAVKTSKDSAQLAISKLEQQSIVKDIKVQQSDKPKSLKSDINLSEVSAPVTKPIKRPISTTVANQTPLNSSGTKQSINTGSIGVCVSPVSQSSNTASFSKNKFSEVIEPTTTTVPFLSKSGSADVPENTNVKTLTSKPKTEIPIISKTSSNSANKSYEPKTSSATLSKATTNTTATPILVSKISNNSKASTSKITTMSNTTRTNTNSVSLPKTTNASNSTAVKSSVNTATSTVTLSQNKNNGKKTVDNNDAKDMKA